MTILLVTAAIFALWSTEQTFIYHMEENSVGRSMAWRSANIWAVLAGGCLVAAALVA